jgi:hypothetical protein
MSETNRPVTDDPLLATRYAAGQLDDAAAAAFERRLAGDQAVRDALCAAVRGMRAAAGRPDPVPNPSYRDRVRNRLRETALRGRPDARARFRGHPAGWAFAGAAAAALLLLAIRGTTEPSDATDCVPCDPVQQAAAPLPRGGEPAEDAEGWPELLSGQHLAQTLHEENRRKSRAEDRRMVRLEDRAAVRGRAPVYRQ